jgi:hypothetical protein
MLRPVKSDPGRPEHTRRDGQVAVHLEPRAGTSTVELQKRLADVGATDIDEIVPGMFTALIDPNAISRLLEIAGVSIMDRKSPKE